MQTSLAAPDEHEFIVVEKGVPGGKGTISLMAMSFIDEDIIAHPRFLLPSGIELEGDAPREFKIPAQGISHLEVTVTIRLSTKAVLIRKVYPCFMIQWCTAPSTLPRICE